MIGQTGQWLADINEGFLESGEVNSLYISDCVGLSLPTFRLEFITNDEDKITEVTKPGFKVKIDIGRDSLSESMNFHCLKRKVTEVTVGDTWCVVLMGVLDNVDYLITQQLAHYYHAKNLLKSSQVWEKIMTDSGLKPITIQSNDPMLYIQANQTHRNFLDDLVWHGYFNKSDPCLAAIRRNGEAVYLPMSEIVKNNKGTIGNTAKSEVKIHGYELIQNDGFLSAWAGKTRITPVYQSEYGEFADVLSEVNPILTSDSGLFDSTRVGEHSFFNDNVHRNWNTAYSQNRQLKSSLSGVSLNATSVEYNPVQVLEVYSTQVAATDVDKRSLVPFGGEWLVVKTSLKIENNSFYQGFELARETLI